MSGDIGFQKVIEEGRPIVWECKASIQRSVPCFLGGLQVKEVENYWDRATVEYSGPT